LAARGRHPARHLATATHVPHLGPRCVRVAPGVRLTGVSNSSGDRRALALLERTRRHGREGPDDLSLPGRNGHACHANAAGDDAAWYRGSSPHIRECRIDCPDALSRAPESGKPSDSRVVPWRLSELGVRARAATVTLRHFNCTSPQSSWPRWLCLFAICGVLRKC
jgi:hypothetical protein